MKLNTFFQELCTFVNNEVGCEKCPHYDYCNTDLGDEIDDKTNFELKKLKRRLLQ